ncbi:MAG: Trk system potassium transporter TrkA [Myxococcales bacterium]|nr:Trk system potassium transporter TrkA [Myxococcales bacterium]
MHIVVIGMGEVGNHLLRVLQHEDHDIIAVDSSAAKIRHIEEHFDVATIHGYGASETVLQRAQVAKADLVVAVTDHDEANLIAALASKQSGTTRVIARVQGMEWGDWDSGVQYGFLGVDVVINPRILVAHELTRIAASHGATEVIGLADDRLQLVQVDVTEETRNTTKPIAQMSLPKDTLVAAVVREDRLFVPGGVDVLLPGDRVYLVGLPGAVLEAEDQFSSRREAKRVCIMGGGVVGETLARGLLEEGAQVLLIERTFKRAEELSAKLARATVVHGEGTDLELLKEEDVASYDLFAAVSSNDEVNLMAALLAKRIDVTRTACIVQHGDHLDIYRQLGIDVALSPRLVASDQILRYAREGSVQSLTLLEGGQAEVLEYTALSGCRAIGLPLHRMNLPRGALMTAIVHEGEVRIPTGQDEVAEGDTVIILTTQEARPMVERIFRGRRSY